MRPDSANENARLTRPNTSITRNGTPRSTLAVSNRGQGQLGGGGGRPQQRRFGALHAPTQPQAFAVGAEQRERGAGQQHRDAAPQQPVEQQQAGQRRQLAIDLFRRPVARDDLQRAAAERVEDRRQRVVVHVLGQQLGDREQHDEGNHADQRGQQRARGGGEQEQHGGDEQQVRQHHHAERPSVAVPVRRT